MQSKSLENLEIFLVIAIFLIITKSTQAITAITENMRVSWMALIHTEYLMVLDKHTGDSRSAENG